MGFICSSVLIYSNFSSGIMSFLKIISLGEISDVRGKSITFIHCQWIPGH